MPADESVGQAELAAERAHLVLEQLAQGLDQLHVHALGQAADIVVRLDGDRRPAGERHALDHVGIECALRQESGRLPAVACELFCFCFKDIDEELANRLALLLRIGDAGERGQKFLRRINVNERNIVVAPEQRDHLLGLGEPQQSVVHEHAGKLLADRLVDQHRRDRGVDAAG